mmetsp:Transcript_106367/g.307821  ORF Transcript_106367/g.307821 Transcript_106367/m.307821 type:complete len:480 (+) Transcript_106367:1056-2495(+)
MTSRQSWKISSCVPGLKTASKLNWLVNTSASPGDRCCEALLAKLFSTSRSTSKVMLSSTHTPGTSPASRSAWLIGRTRQNTRIEPFKSSILLCTFRRIRSASTSSSSGMPSALASWVTLVSWSLASLRASTLVLSMPLTRSMAFATEARTSFPTRRSQSTRSSSRKPPRLASSSAALSCALAAAMDSPQPMSTPLTRSTTCISADQTCRRACASSSRFLRSRSSSSWRFLVSSSSTNRLRAASSSNCLRTISSSSRRLRASSCSSSSKRFLATSSCSRRLRMRYSSSRRVLSLSSSSSSLRLRAISSPLARRSSAELRLAATAASWRLGSHRRTACSGVPDSSALDQPLATDLGEAALRWLMSSASGSSSSPKCFTVWPLGEILELFRSTPKCSCTCRMAFARAPASHLARRNSSKRKSQSPRLVVLAFSKAWRRRSEGVSKQTSPREQGQPPSAPGLGADRTERSLETREIPKPPPSS